MQKAPTVIPVRIPGVNEAKYSVELLEKARAQSDAVLKELGSQLGGLIESEADARLKRLGTNEIAREKRQSVLRRLLSNFANPLVLLLTALGVISYITGGLRVMVNSTATSVQEGKETEVSLKMLVPGDMVPADVRVLSAKDLFLNQAALTGEALPVEKECRVGVGRRSKSARTSLPLFSGFHCGERFRHGCGYLHGQPHLLWIARRQHRWTAPSHQL